MKNFSLVFILFLVTPTLFGQVNSTSFLYKGKVDSLVISIYDVLTKEQMMPDSAGNPKSEEIFSLLNKKKLSNQEISKLNIELKDKRSYAHQRASMFHYDIVINYYLKESIIQLVTISSVSGNITIEKTGCKSIMRHTDSSYQDKDPIRTTYPCLFALKVSKSFKTYIQQLLIKKRMWPKKFNANAFGWE
jgi:hypothetical protein